MHKLGGKFSTSEQSSIHSIENIKNMKGKHQLPYYLNIGEPHIKNPQINRPQIKEPSLRPIKFFHLGQKLIVLKLRNNLWVFLNLGLPNIEVIRYLQLQRHPSTLPPPLLLPQYHLPGNDRIK